MVYYTSVRKTLCAASPRGVRRHVKDRVVGWNIRIIIQKKNELEVNKTYLDNN